MKKIIVTIAALIATGASAQTGPIRPDTFTNRAAVELKGSGPFHQLVLPFAVYQGIHQHDLADLRIFNGQGEVVPYALLRQQSQTVSKRDEVTLPIFPIVVSNNKEGDAGDLSVEIRKNTDGTLVAVKQSGTTIKNGKLVQGVILDASKIENNVRSLRLDVGPSNEPFHAYTVSTSDDLQHWRTLKSHAQLVRMEHDGRRIERNSVEWDGNAGKYLRVLWADPERAPAIKSAGVGTVHTSYDQAARLWSEPIAASKQDDNIYGYSLPGRLPLEQVRINLPQTNTLTQLQVRHYVEGYRYDKRRHVSKEREQGAWVTLANEVVYRLQSPQGEVVSPEITLHARPENRLQLVIDKRGGGVGATPPTLQVGFVPHTLVFLARGPEPFTLAWGAPKVDAAALDIGTLVPGYSADKKLSAAQATLKLANIPTAANVATQTQQDSAAPASRGMLWAVLIIGLLVLGGMAAMLIKQMKQGSAGKPE